MTEKEVTSLDGLIRKSSVRSAAWKRRIEKVIRYNAGLNFQFATLQSRVYEITDFITWFKLIAGKYPEPAQINTDSVLAWLRSGKFKSPATMSTKLAHIKGFCRDLYVLDLVKEIPPVCKSKLPRVPRTVRYPLTEEELKRIWQVVYHERKGKKKLREAVLFELLVSSSPRASELQNLKWSEIDLDRGVIQFKQKGGKHRVIPITKELDRALRRWRSRSQFEYVLRWAIGKAGKGKPTSREAIRYTIRRWFKDASVDRVSYIGAHIWRHTLATRSYKKTRDLEVTRKLLGHEDVKTTQRYIHLPSDEVGGLAELLSKEFRELKEVTKDDEEEL